jgi:allophanate hydrolase
VPNGFTADGRPASLTLFGPAFSDDTLAALARSLPVDDTMTLAVVGLHLSGEPRNGELLDRGATLLGAARTAPCYRLYHLPSGAPGLVRDADQGAAIEIELWQVPAARVGSFLAGIPAPLSLGRIALEDGAEVTGFLCEAYAVAGARDITASGGWRSYRLRGLDT